jgi:hypothetical protein
MRIKSNLFLIISVFLLTMCTGNTAIQLANPIDGLSCSGSAEQMECSYTCPDGTTAGPITFDRDPSLSLSKGELDRRYCDVAPQATPTRLPASATPTELPTNSPTIAASATVVVPATGGDPLLSESVSMCDLGGKLINFRIVEPAPEFTEESLKVQIAEQDSTCYLNQTNSSLLTCLLPNEISFPVHVVVSLDGAVVNDFLYSGVGCAIVTTPTSRPRSYP